MYLFIQKKAKKDNPNATYLVLGVNIGYKDIYLSYKRDVMTELLDVSPRELADRESRTEVGDCLFVADLEEVDQ